MIATITNKLGDIVFSAVCSVREDEFTDEEKREFARLMGEVNTLVMGAVRRREERPVSHPTIPVEAGPFTAAQLRDYRRNHGA